MNEQPPFVSVCMITYNHEKYIAAALEGILMQKTGFPIEIIIGEDCSKDGTRAISEKYAKRYPEIVHLNEPGNNLGAIPNLRKSLEACTGKYIAICEGDDYWTDPLKLQKQVDLLEANPGYSLSFHNAAVLDEPTQQVLRNFNKPGQKAVCNMRDVVSEWLMATASMVFRRDLLVLPPWFNEVYNGDWCMQILLADKGPFGYLPEVMSVYRANSGGFSSNSNSAFVWKKRILLLQMLNGYFEQRHEDLMAEQIKVLERELRQIERVRKYPVIRYLNLQKVIRFINKLKP